MSAKERHPCAIPGCEAGAKPGQLMCWPHWRRVPKALNRAVFDTCATMGQSVEHAAAYRQARAAAIAAVEAKEAEESTA